MLKKMMFGLLVPAFAFCVLGCEVEQTREGRLPDVDVDVDGGEMPEFDVETADVEVGKKKVDIKVPDVDVDMEEKEITVPDVDITMPDEKIEPDELDEINPQ